jgi:predicted GNAT family acetyltransferase
MSPENVGKFLPLARPVRRDFVVCRRSGKAAAARETDGFVAHANDAPNSGLEHMNDAVSDNPALSRYELTVDGHIAATYYKRANGVITFEHTEVPAELGGKGIGSRLVKGALDRVRADGLKVIARCEFVKGWIDKHPDYADLLEA